jgi:hypothetical protein
MVDVNSRTEDWKSLPWKSIQRNVFHLQKRIYQAARRNDIEHVHNLQRLLLRSWSARCLAVRHLHLMHGHCHDLVHGSRCL